MGSGGTWPADVVDIVRGDLMAAFACSTRFGGVSLAPVCPLGMVDVEASTITTSVPLCFTSKLRRLVEAPQAALAFFSRDHGHATTPGFVLAQGDVTFPDAPPEGHIEELHRRWAGYLGPVPERGLVRRLGAAYYDHRVPVALHVRRIQHWNGPRATGAPIVVGVPAADDPTPQAPPKLGIEPRVMPSRYRKQLQRTPHHLLGHLDGEGYPSIVPVDPIIRADRLHVDGERLPPGGRRAALMGFWYNARLHGQGGLHLRGWLDVTAQQASLAPSDRSQFNLPSGAFGQKVIVPIAVGVKYRNAVRLGAVRDDAFVRPA